MNHNILYLAGRSFQLIGLIAMPSAVWVGQLGHNEAGAIGIFVGSILVFAIGYFMASIGKGK